MHLAFVFKHHADWTRRTKEHQYFVRVLYSGHSLRTAHGDLDWVPLSDIVKRLMINVPDDIVSMCNDT